MTLSDLEQLPMLRRLTPEPPDPRPVESVFCCDLLSLAMSRARAGCAWVTVMANLNTVAVATLTDAACLVFAEGITPPEGCVAKAAEEMGLNLSTAKTRLRRGREKLKKYLQEVGYEFAEG